MTRQVKELTAEFLRELLEYNPDTGDFTRLKQRRSYKVGSVAGCMDSDGYVVITIDNKLYKAHRLAWLWVTGVWPQHLTDHRDGNRSNNRWANLRAVTPSGNSHNMAIHKRNTSGYLGVTYRKSSGRWRALIGVNGVQRELGTYPTAEDAYAAYLSAKAILHPTQPVPRQESQAPRIYGD